MVRSRSTFSGTRSYCTAFRARPAATKRLIVSTYARIRYKIVEGPKTYQGSCVEESVEHYLDFVHKNYHDATYVYAEFIEAVEQNDDESLSSGSIIILGVNFDLYDTFLP